jgi:DNA-binding MarR family transcriptional regulator
MAADVGAAADGLPPSEPKTEIFWETYRLAQVFLDVQNHWARILGVSAPQFLILRTVEEIGGSSGTAVKTVATKLDLHPSSITAQSKALEKLGLMQRTTSEADARFVLMSLTTKARNALTDLKPDRQSLDDMIFADLGTDELREFTERVQRLRKRVAKGLRLLTIDEG